MNHVPYEKKNGRYPDFIVEYQIDPDEEVKMVKHRQGMRTDWLYEGDNPKTDGIHMIWPEFLNEDGHVILSQDVDLPSKGYANMWAFWEERRAYHKGRIKIGTKGYLVFGSKKFAQATVVQICSLNEVKS